MYKEWREGVMQAVRLDSPKWHDGDTSIRERAPRPRRAPERRLGALVTELDEGRLASLIRWQRWAHLVSGVDLLEARLAEAAVVDRHAIPADVVTMNSLVLCEDEQTGAWTRFRLVYPRDACGPGDLSVLVPLGAAMLGAKTGTVVEETKGSRKRRLRIRAVPYQPERSGHFHL
jgi:regulator of nucleoside diphosphate kinase